MVTKFPGQWETASSSFQGHPVDQAFAVSSVMSVMRGRKVRSLDFVELEDGSARLVVEFGGKA